jgi:indole-3-acetate monooxygenase
MTTSDPPSENASHASAVLAAARKFAPVLAARSEEIESARRLPADLARALAEAGLFRMLIPEAYGGLEMHPWGVVEVLEELSRADGATGWNVMIGSGTAVCAAWLPEPAAKAIYGAPDVITGGVAAPLGRAEVVPGGHRVSGRWSWASGGENCHWLAGGAVVMNNGAPRMLGAGIPETRVFFFPREDVTLHDTWHASGLCGTGSGDMEVRDAFVPEGRTLSLFEPPRVARPLYAFPPIALLGMGVPAVALGIARRAIDELSTLAQTKRLTPPGPKLLSHRPAVQEAVAEAEAMYRSARAFLSESVDATFDAARRGAVTLRHRAEVRISYVHATQAAARVVDRMYQAGGGTSVFRSSPLQRCLRDIHVATQHAMVGQPVLELAGSVLLGVEDQAPML